MIVWVGVSKESIGSSVLIHTGSFIHRILVWLLNILMNCKHIKELCSYDLYKTNPNKLKEIYKSATHNVLIYNNDEPDAVNQEFTILINVLLAVMSIILEFIAQLKYYAKYSTY